MFGGIDNGLAGDRPFMGRTVVYQPEKDRFEPAVVVDVREDGWTATLRLLGHRGGIAEFVPYGGNHEFGTIPAGSWVTLEEYEGWKIYAEERSAAKGGET